MFLWITLLEKGLGVNPQVVEHKTYSVERNIKTVEDVGGLLYVSPAR